MTTDNNDLAARVAALEAANADMAEQLKHLFKLHGPVTWAHVKKQRRDNAQAAAQRPRFFATPAHGLPKEGQ